MDNILITSSSSADYNGVTNLKSQKYSLPQKTRTKSGNTMLLALFRRCLFFYFLFGGANLIHCVDGKSQYCEVETGQTNIILDIEESRGSCKFNFLNV